MKTQLDWTRFDEEAPEAGRLIILVSDKEPHTLDPIVGRFDEENKYIDLGFEEAPVDVSDLDDEMPLLWAYFEHPTDKTAYAVEKKKDEEETEADDE